MAARQTRVFGMSLGGVLIVVGLWPVLLFGRALRISIVLCGLSLVLAALVAPQSLRLVRRGWMFFGEGIAWCVTRSALTLVYYGLIVPFGIAYLRIKNRWKD